MDPSPSPGPPPPETIAAARALVHQLSNKLTLVIGYAELLAPHVRDDEGSTMLATVEQASLAADEIAFKLARLLQSLEPDHG
jgi:hypothetical protein